MSLLVVILIMLGLAVKALVQGGAKKPVNDIIGMKMPEHAELGNQWHELATKMSHLSNADIEVVFNAMDGYDIGTFWKAQSILLTILPQDVTRGLDTSSSSGSMKKQGSSMRMKLPSDSVSGSSKDGDKKAPEESQLPPAIVETEI